MHENESAKAAGDTGTGPFADRRFARGEIGRLEAEPGPLPSLAGALALLESEIETLEKTLAVHGEDIMQRLDPILALIPTDDNSATVRTMEGDERQSASVGRVNYLANRVNTASGRLDALHSTLMKRIAL